MDKLRLAAVLCLTLWGADAIRAQQFSRRSDPNVVLDAARAVGLRPARTGREPNTAPEGILPSGQDVGPRQPIQYAGRPDGLLDSLARTRDTDPNLYQAYREYLLAYLDGERRKIEEHRDVIASTNRMGTWVFVVVHVFLGLAMVIAVVEFWQASRTRRTKREREEIELSFQKVALKTSMHGTVLLVLSLVLYFLFLKFVYTIVLV